MWSPTRVVERMIAQTARNPGSGRLHPKTHSLTKGSYRLYKDHLSGELPLRHKLINVRKWKHIYRIIDTHTYRLINCFYEYQPPLRANLLHLYFMFATFKDRFFLGISVLFKGLLPCETIGTFGTFRYLSYLGHFWTIWAILDHFGPFLNKSMKTD